VPKDGTWYAKLKIAQHDRKDAVGPPNIVRFSIDTWLPAVAAHSLEQDGTHEIQG